MVYALLEAMLFTIVSVLSMPANIILTLPSVIENVASAALWIGVDSLSIHLFSGFAYPLG